MGDTPAQSWTGVPIRGFAIPRGWFGRVGGRAMAAGNQADQHDVVPLLGVTDGARVLEVGFGPGRLVELLLTDTGAAVVAGVDPSAAMLEVARRRNAAAVAGGRADLRVGTAEATGFADGEFDAVVSVNSVAIWPDVRAGLAELRRVTRPGGRVVITWHSATSGSRWSRRLGLPEERLAELHEAMAAVVGVTVRDELRSSVAFTAARS